MAGIRLYPIGRTECGEEGFIIRLDPKYRAALKGLSDFSHALILWWFDGCDSEKDRNLLTEEKPYKNGPDSIGIFATRSPARPNPIAVSTADIIEVDEDRAVIKLSYIDAMPGSPVLDIKPYIPSADRVMDARVPKWQKNWPDCFEKSGDFDWENEFNF